MDYKYVQNNIDPLDEILRRIKEIRASERRFYRKITDIHCECSYDYNKNAEITRTFYAIVQNKLLYAITGHTAAELIAERADSTKTNMGLTTWKNSPNGSIIQKDVIVAKNYLDNRELSELNDLVSMYLDYVENQVRKNGKIHMKDWMNKLDGFLKFNDYESLDSSGKVSKNFADKIAKKELKKFRIYA